MTVYCFLGFLEPEAPVEFVVDDFRFTIFNLKITNGTLKIMNIKTLPRQNENRDWKNTSDNKLGRTSMEDGIGEEQIATGRRNRLRNRRENIETGRRKERIWYEILLPKLGLTSSYDFSKIYANCHRAYF